MSSTPSLVARNTGATYRLILDTALELLEQSSVSELTARAVAKRAGMSERTVFRYYPSREEFLDAVARAAYDSLATPPAPRSLEELSSYPQELYACYEQKASLIRSILHSELSPRIRKGVGRERWRAVRALIDAAAPHRSERDRRIAAANIHYYLAATAWHYHRVYFGLTLEETIEAAQKALRLAIADILSKPAAASRRSR